MEQSQQKNTAKSNGAGVQLSPHSRRIWGGSDEQTTTILGEFLPADYDKAISIIIDLLDCVKGKLPDFSKIDDNNFNLLMLEYGVVFGNYIEQYGLDYYEASIKAIEKVTQFTSCEFVTHAFISKYPEEMMKQMLAWSTHEHWGVRRLASEGCCPRLPWVMSLPNLKKDPRPIIPILENLSQIRAVECC